MKINWEKRVRNKIWWTSLTSQLFVVIGLLISGGHRLGLWSFNWNSAMNNWAMSFVTGVLVVLSTLGILIDPSTPGVSDKEK